MNETYSVVGITDIDDKVVLSGDLGLVLQEILDDISVDKSGTRVCRHD